MHADEAVLPVIEVIVSLPDVEIEDADGIDFFYFAVGIAQRDMFGNGFCHAVEDTFQVVKLARVLHFDDDNLVFAVPRLDVYTVEFIVNGLLVSFAFQDFDDADRFAQEYENTVRKPSRTSKFAFCRSNRLIAQSNRIYRSCSSLIFNE